jgi:hypothetical protein
MSVRGPRNLPLTDFVCDLETYLTLSLAAHPCDDKTSLLFTIFGRTYGRYGPIDNSFPSGELRILGSVYKPVLVDYETEECQFGRMFGNW